MTIAIVYTTLSLEKFSRQPLFQTVITYNVAHLGWVLDYNPITRMFKEVSWLIGWIRDYNPATGCSKQLIGCYRLTSFHILEAGLQLSNLALKLALFYTCMDLAIK